MRIRTQLLLAAAIAAVVALMVLGSLWYVTERSGAHLRSQDASQDIARDVANLLTLTQEYTVYGGDRASEQWHARYERLRRAVEQALARESAPDPALAEVRQRVIDLLPLYEGLERTYRDGDPGLAQRRRELIVERLVSETQELVEARHRWAKATTERQAREQSVATAVVLAASAVLVALIVGLAFLVRRRVLVPLGNLQAATEAIERGDLSVRCESSTRDELGDTARAVNAMAESLLATNAALQRSEERYALAVAASNDGLWDWDLTTDLIYLSPRAQEIMLGRASDGVDTRHEREWLQWYQPHPDDVSRREAAMRDHLEGRTLRYESEFRVRHADGSYHWVHSRGICLRDTSGRPIRFAGSTTDIDARKRAEDAVRTSEARYARAMEAAGDGHSEWNPETDELYASPRLLEICGFPAGSKFSGRADFLARVPFHPEDRDRFLEAIEGHYAGRSTRLEIDVRLVRRGETRWMHTTLLCSRDAAGALLRVSTANTDVTERKLAEEALRESEARFRSLTELSSDWYWEQDENLRFTYLSSQANDLTGYSGESSIGKTRWELVNMTPVSCSWPEHQAVLEARQPFRDLELRRVAPDGTVRYLSVSGAPVLDEQGRFKGYQGIGRNITERKRVEEALRLSEERFALAVAGANEGIFDWDLVSDRVYVSQRAQELFGLSPGELWRPRRDWRHLVTFHPEDAKRMHDALKALIEGPAEMYDEEFRIVVQGDDVRWFRQRGIALRNASGKVYRMIGSIGDITDRKTAQEERLRLERQLRLAQRLEAMGTLAGGIAHDFNNLLGAILGYGEMALRNAPKGTRLRRDLDSIMTAGERGRLLVDRVLAFSRSGLGERVAVHVEKVVREALDLLEANLPKGIRVQAKLGAGRAAILGDPTQVHQVLMNLGTNAVQAMPSGGTLHVSLNAVRCEAGRAATVGNVAAGEYVVLTVTDAGTGIPRDIIERIFDPFFTTKEVGTGTGLGLSLVHSIVADLDGAIDVVSTLGQGSEFTVYLPRSGDAPEAGEGEAAAMPRGDGQRVLIVDDEEPLVRLATRTLEELGYLPTGLTSSTAALAAFRADPEAFDAVITDERMPGMTGSALIRELRGIRRQIPILLMSGYVGGAVASRAHEAGANEVMNKPLSARDLATSLARVLRA